MACRSLFTVFIAVGLVERYQRDVGDVAVLTPYKAQLAQLRRTFQQVGLLLKSQVLQAAWMLHRLHA